jgi:hypothetical protein
MPATHLPSTFMTEVTVSRSAIMMISMVIFTVILLTVGWIASTHAEEKSIYTPIIHIDKEKGWILVSNSGAVFYVQASEAARPHIEKLPVSGLIDLVIEPQPNGPPIIKSWKLASGESTCKVFDGKSCK